ncbi:rod shape-determining protein MreD [Baaleninema sp.]|uniref:rod shape-determining protein MreD n=1 Tax=Baaleninema sp. TaxID=3101197 RepID=UPI003D06089D
MANTRSILGWHAFSRRALNWAVTIGSVMLCLLLLPTRFPGMELFGMAPNWLLIWVVAWSVKRSMWEGAVAGIVLGLLQDGMVADVPTRAISLAVVGMLTARLQKQRYIQEDFISVALIVFGMSVLADTITAIQFSIYSLRLPDRASFLSIEEIWDYYQQVALASAVLSSLWGPVLYYPLNHWWERQRDRT